MSKKKGQQIVFPLGSEEEFFAAIEASSKYLTVVDIHQGWCGPCSIMEPIYRKAYIELDRAEERLKFYTIEAEKLTEKGRAGLPVTEACKPLFVVYKVSAVGTWRGHSPHALAVRAEPLAAQLQGCTRVQHGLAPRAAWHAYAHTRYTLHNTHNHRMARPSARCRARRRQSWRLLCLTMFPMCQGTVKNEEL